MSRLRLGPDVATITGSLDGVTYSMSTLGPSLHSRRGRPPTQTTRSGVTRSRLAYLSQCWRALPAADRARWVARAASDPLFAAGDPLQRLSGQQLFISLGAHRMFTGASFQNVPPPHEPLPHFTAFALSAKSFPVPILQVNFTATYTVPTCAFDFWATPPISAGVRQPKPGLFRYLRSFVGSTSSPISLATSWSALFGPIGVPLRGARICVYMRARGTYGWSTPVIRASCVIT